jgi:hypothetical protein
MYASERAHHNEQEHSERRNQNHRFNFHGH